MSNSTNLIAATAPVVRAAYAQGLFKAPEGVSLASLVGSNGKGDKVRGRIHPRHAEALVAAQPKKYRLAGPEDKVTSAVKSSLVSVPRWSQKTGRPVKPVEMTAAEVRALVGKPDLKGRLSKATLAEAAKALGFGAPEPKE